MLKICDVDIFSFQDIFSYIFKNELFWSFYYSDYEHQKLIFLTVPVRKLFKVIQ